VPERIRLSFQARVVLSLNVLYNVADALCAVFVGVYFLIHSLDIAVVCYHYLALYIVTPVVYLLAGWYSQRFDRLHVYRLGVTFHGLYYGLLLWLQAAATDHVVALGVLLGVAWGLFWAGNNTFNYDVVEARNRDYFFGWLNALVNASRCAAPAVSALVLYWSPDGEQGYHMLFGAAVLLYVASVAASFFVERDGTCRPFRLARALFPGKDQRDWRLVMAASATQAGSFHIFYFLLGLAMYMKTESATTVGVFTAFQYVTGIVVSYAIGSTIKPETRKPAMFFASLLLVVAGAIIAWDINMTTLIVFGLIRSIALPLFMIPFSSIRLDVIDQSAEEPAQRIEYMAASEVPLAAGRIVMMVLLLILSGYLDELGLRIALFMLCANRLLTYWCLASTSVVKNAEKVVP
jgi:MFS transporter, YQGE family, putative transporter